MKIECKEYKPGDIFRIHLEIPCEVYPTKEETIKEIEPEEEETEAKKVIEDEKNIEDQNFELSQEQDKEQENK